MNKLRILCISDLHNDVESVAKVVALYDNNEIDLVLCSGDITNYNDDMEDKPSSLENQFEVEQVIKCIVDGFNGEVDVLWIPGNHDELSNFDPSVTSKMSGIACHGEVRRIGEGLMLAGLGGAPPGYQNGYEVWSGYPFSENQLGEKLDSLMSRVEPGHQVLLMTHFGPYNTSTSIDTRHPSRDPIQSGSTNLRRLLLDEENQARVLLNVHGHTHHGVGSCCIGSARIFNPGSLKQGNYGVMLLEQVVDDVSARWIVKKIEHNTL